MGIFHHTVLGGNFDLEVSFNAGDGVNDNLAQFLFLLSLEFAYHGHVGVVKFLIERCY